MKKIVKILLALLLAVVVTLSASAQPVEMADKMRAEGKIYVVVAIVLIVLSGLVSYLFLLDRKVKKLEDKLSGKSR